jgi:threonine/homoserine/homoserine lactone efflux protein
VGHEQDTSRGGGDHVTGSELVSLLILAVAAAASPFSLIAFSLVLATDRGPKNGIAFICGWIVTVTLIGVAMALLGSGVEFNQSNTAGKWTLALELALGVVLIFLWVRRRFRPKPTEIEAAVVVPVVEKPAPAWQRKIGTMGYFGAFIAGGAVQTWPVMIAAAAEILRLDLSGAQKLEWMFIFAVATTAGIVVLEVLAWRSPGSAAARLQQIRTYVDVHRDAVINWAFLVGGLWLFFRGLLGLI